jgi:hypothetical protein
MTPTNYWPRSPRLPATQAGDYRGRPERRMNLSRRGAACFICLVLTALWAEGRAILGQRGLPHTIVFRESGCCGMSLSFLQRRFEDEQSDLSSKGSVTVLRSPGVTLTLGRTKFRYDRWVVGNDVLRKLREQNADVKFVKRTK